MTAEGFNQREADVSRAFREAVQRIVTLKPDVTLIAGDLFHSIRPSNAIVTFCFRELKRLAAGTGSPVVLIAGNHESPKRADSGSLLRLFSEIDGVHVADTEARWFRFPEKQLAVFCVPHAALRDFESLDLRADDAFDHNVLVAHAQIGEEWLSDFGGFTLSQEALKPFEWDYIALGHVHLHQIVAPNIVYPGSLEYTSTNVWLECQAPKGFVEVALPEGKRTFHPLSAPRDVVILPPIDAAEMDAEDVNALVLRRLEEAPGGIDGKIVKLTVSNLPRSVFRALDHREIRRWRARALNLSLQVLPTDKRATATEVRTVRSKPLAEQLVSFCEERPAHVGIEGETVAKKLLELLERVEANSEARQSET